MATRRRTTAPNTPTKPTDIAGKTGFIVLTRDDEGDPWKIFTGEYGEGGDIHSSIEKAKECGCCQENGAENVAILEVVIVAQHERSNTFSKTPTIGIKFND